MLYLDHNATTPMDPAVEQALIETLSVFGNPSSLHRWGQKARFLLEESRSRVAAACRRHPEEVVFTATATEALNLAIQGWVRAHPKGRILTSHVEHPAVLVTVQTLRKEGFPICFLPVNPHGQVDLDSLEKELQRGPALIVIQAASGETGVLQPWGAIRNLAEEYESVWLSDAVQIPGKEDLLAIGGMAHLLVISSHKVYGPKGIACLIRPANLPLVPLMYGGDQESGLRPGTENPALAWAFATALSLAQERLVQDVRQMRAFQQQLEEGLTSMGLDIVAHQAPRLPNTTMFFSPTMEGSHMVAALDLEGIGVSSTTACLTGKQKPSLSLQAMGYTPAMARRAVRISAGRWTHPDDAQKVLDALERIIHR